MFLPDINKNKKKQKIGTQQMHKQVEEVMKQLAVKVKKALKIIDSDLVSDFNKVCRLKQIPQFYSNYFFHFIQKSTESEMKIKFSEEIQKIMMGKSYYNLIANLLKQREKNILQINNKLSIVQGFVLMNAGKTVPMTIKVIINQMIKDCKTLEGLKIVEQRAIDQLASLVKQVRDKLKELVQIYISWKFTLHKFQGADVSSIKKMKILFPYNGINCILYSLYDFQFIKMSFLVHQVKFLKVDYDPFLLSIEQLKKGNKLLQQNFVQFLNGTKTIYQPSHNTIIAQIPKDIQKLKQQQVNNLQKKKFERETKSAAKLNLSSSKILGRPQSQDKKRKKIEKDGLSFLHSKMILESNHQSESRVRKSRINSMKNIINIDMIDKVYSKKKKSNKMIDKDEGLSKSRSKEKIKNQKNLQNSQINVKPQSSLSSRKISNKKFGNKSKERQVQIQNLYSLKKKSKQLSPNKSLQKSLVKSQNLEVMVEQNKRLEKEINQQKKQKQKLMKIVKRVESRTQSENKFFQKKMEDYEKQVTQLKEKLKDRQQKVKQKINQKQINEFSAKNNKKSQIQKVYKVYREVSNSPYINLAQSQIIQEKQTNKNLEKTIKQLNKQKLKLQKILQTESGKINKEKALYQKKLQKYEQIIEKLKQEVEESKNKARNANNATVQQKYSSLKNNNESIKNIYQKDVKDLSQREQQKRKPASVVNFTNLIVEQVKKVKYSKNSPLKIQKTQNKNNFVLKPDRLEPVSFQQKNIVDKSKGLEIVQNKKKNAIQIIYDMSRRKRSKSKNVQTQKKAQENIKFSRTNQFETKMSRLEKQKQILQKKLSITADNRSSIEVTLMKQLQAKQNQLQKYKNILQREQNKKYGLETKMKQVRKNLTDQYQNRLQRERQRFLNQKQILSKKLQQQKQQKKQKQKFLSKQLIFLKEMQMKEQQLLAILEHQRHEKYLKQVQLQREMQKKQEALRLLQIQEIKKQIQLQVRKQLEYQQEEDELQDKQEDISLLQRKEEMRRQIQEMLMNNNEELNQIDQQNQKLKDLIQRIKQEEQKVIQTMKYDVEEQNDEEQQRHLMNLQQGRQEDIQQDKQDKTTVKEKQQIILNQSLQNIKNNNSKIIQNTSNISQRNLQLTKQLKRKTDLQLDKEQLSFSRLRSIESSPQYKDRDKIQSLIQHYLSKPFQYPKQGVVVNSTLSAAKDNKKYKNQLVEQLTNKSRKIREFEQELLAVKHMQNFVPAERDDPLTSHMLNLREAYQNQQADQLKRILFPAQMDKNGNQQMQDELSFESEQTAPPVTLLDHLKIHQKQYENQKKKKKNNNNKNFLAINRLKLLQIQQQKKQKQRQMIEEATKRKVNALKMKQKLLKAKRKRQKEQEQRKNNPDVKKNQEETEKKSSLKKKNKKTQKYAKKQQKKQVQKKAKIINDKNIIMEPLEQQNQNQFLDEQVFKKMQSQEQAKKMNDKNKQIRNEQPQILKSQNQKDNSQEQQAQNYSDKFQESEQQNFDNLNENQFLQKFQMLDEQIYGKEKKKTPQQEEKLEQKEKVQQLQEKNQFLQNQKQQNQQNQMNQQEIQQTSENIALMLLQSQKAKLQSDILSYQDDIRSYISQQQYEVYQHYLKETELKTYIKDLLQLSSSQIIALNNNQTLLKDLQDTESISVLVAKDYERNLQIGIGVFHKEYSNQGEYVCDFVLAHNMKYFLNMIFNFCRHIFKKDQFTNQVQFIFTLNAIQEQSTIIHFTLFQEKCKRLGEVYVKSHTDKMRKYILKRNLFESKGIDYEYPQEYKGLQIKTKVQIHQKLYKEKGKGFINSNKVQYSSLDILLAYYFRNNEEQLAIFRKKIQNDLKYRELLITSLLFEKKQISIKNIHQKHLNEQKKSEVYQQIADKFFDVSHNDTGPVTETFFGLSGDLSKTVKRCQLNFDNYDIPYIIMHPAEAVNQIQSSNSSQVGTFLNLAPKYKILILPAEQYYMMESQNPDISVFFYIKHFIKNISQVKKQTYSRVYLPQINSQKWLFYKDLSERLQQTIFQKQVIQIGWKNELFNSLIYQPHHRDLIVQKPFIISLLSANIQKVVEGSSIFCKLIE